MYLLMDNWILFSRTIFKKVKKQIYWFLFERKNLLNSKSIFLTSNAEKQLLNNTYVNTKGIKKKLYHMV